MKLKKGDNVIVLSGNDKGKTGEVLEVIPKSEKVVVKGINVRKRHVKAAPNKEGGIVASEFPIHSSIVNIQELVMLLKMERNLEFAKNAIAK